MAMMQHQKNPVRKVVTLLQKMTKQVEEEGEKMKELYDKFMCYCQTGTGDLTKSISAAETKIPQLESEIKEGKSQLTGLKEDVTSAIADKKSAESAMAEAKSLRAKEKSSFDKESSEMKADLSAAKKAIVALEHGVSGFLQTPAAQHLRQIVHLKTDLLDDSERDTLTSFLEAKQGGYVSTDEIIGILQEMVSEMSKDLAEITEAEESSVTAYEELMVAKAKEVKALTKAIESKTSRIGILAVEVVEKEGDLSDTEEALAEDKKVLATLQKSCKSKTVEFEKEEKIRAQELVALAETIKILNDDDAADLFKKAIPSASSFLQIEETAQSVKSRALQKIRSAPRTNNLQQLDFIALALRGKKSGFEKVIRMIDVFVGDLKKEQEDDNSKKGYCLKEFAKSEDKKKATEHTIKDLETVSSDTEEAIETVSEEIEALVAGIKALDKSVAEATAQRKEEHAEYTELMADDGAAKEVLAFAKNRLNKFYNPKLYNPPPKKHMDREDQIYTAMDGAASFVQESMDSQDENEAPVREESNGVIAMINILIGSLDKEMTEAETSEKDAQADYEVMMKDAQDKRAEDSKALENKEAAKADMEESIQKSKGEKDSATKELAATIAYIHSLHADCDWLSKYYEVRKQARAGQAKSLVDAKAVLSGADYSFEEVETESSSSSSSSFLQTSSRKNLHNRRV
jgi:septal ring factor EnvC (AmiA/AmiB activator)